MALARRIEPNWARAKAGAGSILALAAHRVARAAAALCEIRALS